MYLKLIGGLIAAATFASPALAQDAPDTREPAPTFSGFRIEGLVGWDHTEILDDDQGAIMYGLGVGYDYQTGRAVLGIEAEASDSNNNGCLNDLIGTGDRFCVGTGRDLYIGGRAGLIVGRSVLLFGKAGYVNTRFTSEYDPGGGGVATNSHFNQDGLRVGLGVELALSRHAFIRGETRYSNYMNGGDRGAVLGAFGFRF
jgi:outer membrane immunogenic protein